MSGHAVDEAERVTSAGPADGARSADGTTPGAGRRAVVIAAGLLVGLGVVLFVVMRDADRAPQVPPTAERLLDAVPESVGDETTQILWIDAEAATTDSEDSRPSWMGHGDPDRFWAQMGVDLDDVDGWITFGSPPHETLVVVGDLSADAIDTAVRENSGSDLLEVGSHRGVVTYSWREDLAQDVTRAADFPGFRALRIALVDDVLILTSATSSLHTAIDVQLDGGPSLVARPPIRRLMAAVADGETPASGILMTRSEHPYLAHAFGRPHPDELGSLFLAVDRDADPAVLADRIRRDVDASLAAWRDDNADSPLAEVRAAVQVRQDILIVRIEAADLDRVDTAGDRVDDEFRTTVAPLVYAAVLPQAHGTSSTTGDG